jgi:hypothetical protein
MAVRILGDDGSLMPNTDQVDAPSAQQDNFPVPMDPGIAAMLARAARPQTPPSTLATSLNYAPSYPITGNYSPSPLDAPPTPTPPATRNMPFPGQVDPRGVFAPRSAVAARPAVASNTGPDGADVSGIFNNLPNNVFDGARNAVQTAQAPASATPQGWNLFTALGQALSHLLGFNAAGQPQGMSGLVRNPVQPAPTQTAALRMPTPVQPAARYQGRTLLG